MFELMFRHDLLDGAGADLRSSVHGIAVLHGNRVFDVVGSVDVDVLVAEAVESAIRA